MGSETTSSSSADLEEYLDRDDRTQKGVPAGTLRSLVALILKHSFPLCMGIAMVILGTFATLLEPRIYGYAIDEGIVPRRWDRLQFIVVIFLCVTLIRVF